MFSLHRILLLVVICALAGCKTIGPGMHAETTMIRQSNSEKSYRKDIKTVVITPKLIATQKQQAQKQINQLYFTDKRLARYSYRIGVGDVLGIIVWDHESLNNPTQSTATFEQLGYVVEPDGRIYYPFVGWVNVKGLTTKQIHHRLTRKLSRIIKKPQISVKIISYLSKHVNVLGELNKQNIVPLTNVPLSISDAIDKVGGTNTFADLDNVVLKRGGKNFHLNIRRNTKQAHILLKQNDVVYVPNIREQKVFLFGEFLEPKALTLDTYNITLAEALAAGGVNQETSNPRLILVFRNQGPHMIAYRLDASSPSALLLASKFILHPRDAVYIGTNSLVQYNRIISQIAPTARMAADMARATEDFNNVFDNGRFSSNTNSRDFATNSS